MRRTKEEAAQTKEKIFQAGLRVFTEKGFDAATISDIVKASGYTRGAVYWHFENKEAFISELYSRTGAKIVQVISDNLETHNSLLKTLLEISKLLLVRCLEDEEWKQMNQLIIQSTSSEGLQRLHQKHAEAMAEIFIPIIEEAMENGSIRKFSSPYVVFNVLTLIFKGLISSFMPFPASSEEEVEEMLEILIRGIEGEKAYLTLGEQHAQN